MREICLALLLLVSCTPAEEQVAETVAKDAAEIAVEVLK